MADVCQTPLVQITKSKATLCLVFCQRPRFFGGDLNVASKYMDVLNDAASGAAAFPSACWHSIRGQQALLFGKVKSHQQTLAFLLCGWSTFRLQCVAGCCFKVHFFKLWQWCRPQNAKNPFTRPLFASKYMIGKRAWSDTHTHTHAHTHTHTLRLNPLALVVLWHDPRSLWEGTNNLKKETTKQQPVLTNCQSPKRRA